MPGGGSWALARPKNGRHAATNDHLLARIALLRSSGNDKTKITHLSTRMGKLVSDAG
jgi:hypothetical protein